MSDSAENRVRGLCCTTHLTKGDRGDLCVLCRLDDAEALLRKIADWWDAGLRRAAFGGKTMNEFPVMTMRAFLAAVKEGDGAEEASDE